MAMEKIRTLLETDQQTQQRRNEEQLLKSLSPEIREKYISSEYKNPTSRHLTLKDSAASAELLLGPMMLGIPGVGGLPAKISGPLAKGGQFVMDALKGNRGLQAAGVLGAGSAAISASDQYNQEKAQATPSQSAQGTPTSVPEFLPGQVPEVPPLTLGSFRSAKVPSFIPGQMPEAPSLRFGQPDKTLSAHTRPSARDEFLSALSGLERPTPAMPDTNRKGDLERQMQVAQGQESRMTGSGYVEPKRGIAERIIGKVKPVTDFLFHNEYDPDADYKREVARQMTEAQLKQLQSSIMPSEQVTASDAMAEADRKRALQSQVDMAEYGRTGQMDPQQLERLSFLRSQAEREGGHQNVLQQMTEGERLSLESTLQKMTEGERLSLNSALVRMNEAEKLSRESARMPNPTGVRENLAARAPYMFDPDQLAQLTGMNIDPAALEMMIRSELMPKTDPLQEAVARMLDRANLGVGGINTGE